MRVLVVEDEGDLAGTLIKALSEEGFAVDVSADGEEALFRLREIPYDAVILDLMLPRLDGWTLLERARRDGIRTPVLVLTARDALRDKIRGLDAGADDYLTKPFALGELLARVRALVRRSSVDPAPVLVVGDVTIDTASKTVRRAGEVVPLTAREYSILEYLARRRGTVVTRTTLYDHIYDDRVAFVSNVIDVHVAALRRKLGRTLIQTRRGQGYLIDA